MKLNVFLLVGLFLIPLFSCQEKSESSFVEIETSLNMDIPIIAEVFDNTKSGLNNSEIDYSFAGESTYSPASLANSEKEIYNIKKIRPNTGTILKFPGIKEGNEIYSLLLEWGYKSSTGEDYIMQEPIDLLSLENMVKDEIFTVNLDNALNQLINNIDSNHNKSFKINIKGKSNFNINSIAKLEIPVIVESETFNTRFELY